MPARHRRPGSTRRARRARARARRHSRLPVPLPLQPGTRGGCPAGRSMVRRRAEQRRPERPRQHPAPHPIGPRAAWHGSHQDLTDGRGHASRRSNERPAMANRHPDGEGNEAHGSNHPANGCSRRRALASVVRQPGSADVAAAALNAVVIGAIGGAGVHDATCLAVRRVGKQPAVLGAVLVVIRILKGPHRQRNTDARQPEPVPLGDRRREVGWVAAQVRRRPAGVVAVVSECRVRGGRAPATRAVASRPGERPP